jgi:hypothetical protein
MFDLREYNREYYRKNRKKLNLKTKLWRKNNVERQREISRRYRENHVELRRQLNKKWAEKHRAERAEYYRKYRKAPRGTNAFASVDERLREKYKPKRKVWNQAVKIEKKPCIVCGEARSHKHHPDYSKPLEVVHLCALHHKKVHSGEIVLTRVTHSDTV